MIKKMIGLSLFLAFGLSLLLMIPASAQDQPELPRPVSDDEVNAIAKQMYCPICENTPLDVCPTQACAEWRELIREKLEEGWDERQINAYFVQRFGDRVMAVPPAQGINWLVYLVPPIAILAGLVLVFRSFRSWGGPNLRASQIDPGESDPKVHPYMEQMEEELRKAKE